MLYYLELKHDEIEIDGRAMIRENTKWKCIIFYLISDCITNPNSRANGLEYEEKSLTRVVVAYNKCKNASYNETKVNKPWTRYEIGARIGMTRSVIVNSGTIGQFSFLDKRYSSIDPSYGLMFSILFPRMAEKIAFQCEVHFMKSSSSAHVEINDVSTKYHDTHINLTTISLPLSVKYSINGRLMDVYVQGGINIDNHLIAKTRLLSEHVSGNIVTIYPERSAFEIKSNQMGSWVGVGLLRSYQKFTGGVVLRYTYMPSFNETIGLSSKYYKTSINIVLIKR